MAYILIEDFKLGLDRRKDRVAGVPGSLWGLANGHITRGGEIEGPKKFDPTYGLPAGTFGMAALNDTLYVFGHGADPGVPSGVTYQRLMHPDGSTAMTKVLDAEANDGKLYVIAKYADGKIFHFYDGALVSDWWAGIVRTDHGDNSGVARHFNGLFVGDSDYSGTVTGSLLTVTGLVNTAFSASIVTENGSLVNDQGITVSTSQIAVAAVPEVLATGSFRITGGSAGNGSITAVTVNSVAVNGTVVIPWATSNAVTAANVAAQINSFTSTPDYTATATSDVVTISAATGSGDSPNTFPVAVTVAGDLTVGSIVAMQGGSDAVAGQPQITGFQFTGTWEIGDKLAVRLTQNSEIKVFGYDGQPTPVGTMALTFKGKMHSAGGKLVNSSAVSAPTQWNRDNTDNAGAGFINPASQDEGAQTVTALGIFQGQMAIYAEKVIQTWNIDPDPDANTYLNTVKNTGTKSHRSVLAYGNNDVFYLDSDGIRSLKARDQSNAPYVSDVGTAIDPLVQEYTGTLTSDEIADAVSTIEPRDGRFWMAVADRVFVFSYFPASRISAWSYLEPGFRITDFATIGKKLYARSGTLIYLYGGATGTLYPGEGEMATVVETPFLTAGKPGTEKNFEGFDGAFVNAWSVKLLTNPNLESSEINLGIATNITYQTGRLTWPGQVKTHVGAKMTCSGAGRRKISNIAFYYEGEAEDG